MRVNKEKESLLTQEYLKSILNYNPVSGLFIWIRKTHVSSQRIRIGFNAGIIKKSTGYVVITINGNFYYAHRLTWLYAYGEFPQEEEQPFIDHIDGNKVNNQMRNLRKSSTSENNRNRGLFKETKSGVRSVKQVPSGNFQANIRNPLTKTMEYIGTYETEGAASSAWNTKALEYQGEFFRGTTDNVTKTISTNTSGN